MKNDIISEVDEMGVKTAIRFPRIGWGIDKADWMDWTAKTCPICKDTYALSIFHSDLDMKGAKKGRFVWEFERHVASCLFVQRMKELLEKTKNAKS